MLIKSTFGGKMSGAIKYQYAENSSGKLININIISKNDCHEEKYICLDCKQELIPKLGDIRAHHFSHKTDIYNCSKETYLHELGKKIFYETYIQCLNANEPFYITVSALAVCKYNRFMEKNCIKKDVIKFDLTSRFKNIEYEKNQGNFRPDITLFNDSGEMIFIEIAVTHPCDAEKIASKNKIIEISIKDESDVNLICKKELTDQSEYIKNFNLGENLQEKNDHVKFYNFEDFYISAEPVCNDNTLFAYFVVLKDGRKEPVQWHRRKVCQFVYENKDNIVDIKPIIPTGGISLMVNHNRGGPRINDIEAKYFNSKNQHKSKHNFRPRKKWK